jgi:Family of unknown function (DUF6159)
MGRITRGWELTKQSWTVLKNDRSLVLFPILSTIFALLAVGVIWAPTLVLRGVFQGHHVHKHDPVFYVAGVASAYVSTFVAIFFNVALAACAVRSLRGEDTKVSEGLQAAWHRIGPILGWTFVTTTVGLILKALAERFEFLGKIVADIAGAVWAIATFFVIPVLAMEGTGPIDSLKRSGAIVKARWGEGATGAATIGLATFLINLLIVIVAAVGAVFLFAANLLVLGGCVIALAVTAVIIVSFVSTALNQIFRVALYQYAVTGSTPGGFDRELLQSAFAGQGGYRPPSNSTF